MAIEKNRMWAKASRGAKRHGGVDPVLARFITGGGDDAALIRSAAYHNRLAAQFGALEQFHGDEEGVHVDVENRAIGRNLARVRRIMLGAKASQVRHGISLRLQRRCDNPFSGEDAGDTGKVVGDTDIAPMGGVEKRLNRRQAVVAQLQNEEAAGF